MSSHFMRWWTYCLLFALGWQMFLGPVLGLEFQDMHLSFSPEGSRSITHVPNETCAFRGVPFSVDDFMKKAAVECYQYTNGLRDEYRGRVCYRARYPKICLNCTGERPNSEEDCHLPDWSNEESPLFLAFRTKEIGRLWLDCVHQASNCCQDMLEEPRRPGGTYCNRTWDGLTCYRDTVAGTNVSMVCPSVLYIYSTPHCEYFSQRWCHENGSWYKIRDMERTFYTGCSPKPWEYVGLYHYSIGLFAVSVVSLIPALLVFNWYK